MCSIMPLMEKELCHTRMLVSHYLRYLEFKTLRGGVKKRPTSINDKAYLWNG